MQRPLTCVEICAGAGGQALGLAMAGFVHVALVEYERDYCKVLKDNRPEWNVICADVHSFDGRPYKGVDLLAGGVPCPPFSVAGKQLGKDDERDLFPEAIRLIREIRPRAVMLENVRGFLDSGFEEYRDHIFTEIKKLGYVTHIKLLNASDYGVPQLRPRVVIVGIRKDQAGAFEYPQEHPGESPTVGETLCDLMSQNGWKGAKKNGLKELIGLHLHWLEALKSMADRTLARQEQKMHGQSLALTERELQMRHRNRILTGCLD